MDNLALVEGFLAGKGYKELAEEFQVRVGAVRARVHYLRECGVRLPHIGRSNEIDVDGLNRLIDSDLRG